MGMSRICSSLTLACLGLALLSCSEPEGSSKLRVVASIGPLADVSESIGGEHIDVTVLIPPGASPHTFEPTPEQFRRFSRAKLFVMVGAGLEFWAEKLVSAATDDSITILRASDDADPIGLSDREHGEHESHEDRNPHVWLDPTVMMDFAERIASALVALDPENAESYRSNAVAYRTALDSLDAEIRATVEGFRVKEYVAFHPAWAYFARRYGLREVGIIEASPGRDPSPKDLKAIVDAVKRFDIRAVFAEPQLNPTAAEVIAEEAGVRVLLLDPLGDPDLPERDTYLELMRYNLRVLSGAMR
jgi:zinc transport system substrate-binding protein